MTAIETIRAAIVKLEWLKAESTSGPWLVEEIPETGECRLIREFKFFVGPQIEVVAPGGMLAQDAKLIVTLHNTIDVQLAILHDALDDIARWLDPDSEYGWEPQDGPTPNGQRFANMLALARAINGGVS